MVEITFQSVEPRRWSNHALALVIAALLCAMLGYFAWAWIQPYDQALSVEQQLATASADELPKLMSKLLTLGEPGQRVLLQEFNSPHKAVRQQSRLLWWEQVQRWQSKPQTIPQHLDQLTNLLEQQLQQLTPAERYELRHLVDRWLELPVATTAGTGHADWQVRRSLVNLVSRTNLEQGLASSLTATPAENKTTERTAQRQIPRELPLETGSPRFLSEEAPAALPALQPPTNEAPQSLPVLTPATSQIIPPQVTPQPNLAPAIPDTHSPSRAGTANQPAMLSADSTSRPIPLTSNPQPNATLPKDNVSLSTWSSEQFLASDVLLEYHASAATERTRYWQTWSTLPWSKSERELLEIHATGDVNAVLAAIQELPQRQELSINLWLRAFARHPQPAARKAALAWLITSTDRATIQWLQQLTALEPDPQIRDWLSENLRLASSQQRRNQR